MLAKEKESILRRFEVGDVSSEFTRIGRATGERKNIVKLDPTKTFMGSDYFIRERKIFARDGVVSDQRHGQEHRKRSDYPHGASERQEGRVGQAPTRLALGRGLDERATKRSTKPTSKDGRHRKSDSQKSGRSGRTKWEYEDVCYTNADQVQIMRPKSAAASARGRKFSVDSDDSSLDGDIEIVDVDDMLSSDDDDNDCLRSVSKLVGPGNREASLCRVNARDGTTARGQAAEREPAKSRVVRSRSDQDWIHREIDRQQRLGSSSRDQNGGSKTRGQIFVKKDPYDLSAIKDKLFVSNSDKLISKYRERIASLSDPHDLTPAKQELYPGTTGISSRQSHSDRAPYVPDQAANTLSSRRKSHPLLPRRLKPLSENASGQ